MAKTIVNSFTLNSRDRYMQTRACHEGPVLMIAADDATKNGILDVWVEAEDLRDGADLNKVPTRRFLVLRAFDEVPEGYIHVASTVNAQGDAYHLYELDEKPTAGSAPSTLNEGLPSDTVREFDPIFGFRLVVGGRLVGTGLVDRDGAMDLLNVYADLGHFAKTEFLDKALENGHRSVAIEGRGKHPRYITFIKL